MLYFSIAISTMISFVFNEFSYEKLENVSVDAEMTVGDRQEVLIPSVIEIYDDCYNVYDR